MSVPFPSRVGSRGWIASLAAMTAIVAMSIDTSLPAQPVLARVFAVSPGTAALTLSLFLAGFAGAQLVTGYLSDAWGRRRVLTVSLALFVAATAACALAPDIGALLACRVLAGVAAAGAPVVARAMVRDTQPAADAARLLSAMLAVLAVAPMLAPTVGGVLLDASGWRAIFAWLAGVGGVLLVLAQLTLVETRPAAQRSAASLRGLFGAYATFVTTPGTLAPLLVGCASFAGQFAWIASSPFILERYGIVGRAYGLCFGATALALMLGSIGGGRMIRRGRSPRVMIVVGSALLALGGCALVATTHLVAGETLGLAGLLAPVIVYFVGIGLASPSATAIAMEPVPEIAGTASSAVGFAAMAAGAISGYLTTRFAAATTGDFALVLAAMGALALGLALATARWPGART